MDAVFETCPHILLLTDGAEIGVWGKVNPPLPGAADQAALWAGLTSGAIDVIGSGHCPFDSGAIAPRADADLAVIDESAAEFRLRRARGVATRSPTTAGP